MIRCLTLSLKKEDVLVDQARIPCGKCCKKHYGDCLIGTNNCFVYEKSGHKVRDCPNLKGQYKGSGQAHASGSNV